MKKILFTLLLIVSFTINVKATTIDKIYIDAETEIAGGLRVNEIIKVSDQDGPVKIKIYYKDKSLKEFKGDTESFKSSSIYDGEGVQLFNIGKVKDGVDIEKYTEDNFYSDNVEDVEFDYKDDGEYYIITLPENKGDYVYYLCYTVLNVLVENKDSAELYFRFLDDFDYDVKSITIMTKLPYHSNLFKVWAHGTKNTKVSIDGESSIVHNEITNYKKGEYLDNRILFDLDLFMLNINEGKKTNMDAINIVEKIENERLNNVNKTNILGIVFAGSLLLLIILIIVYIIYSKRKKHIKSKQ